MTNDIHNSKPESAQKFCNRTMKGIKAKADHNKSEALWCFILVIASTLLTPLFITLGEGLILGKIVPSVLSIIAAGVTAWLQLRKPQQLWAAYRTAHRELEDQETKFQHGIGDYENAENPEKLLAEKVAEIALNLHYQWLPLVPNPENIRAIEVGYGKSLDNSIVKKSDE